MRNSGKRKKIGRPLSVFLHRYGLQQLPAKVKSLNSSSSSPPKLLTQNIEKQSWQSEIEEGGEENVKEKNEEQKTFSNKEFV